MISDDYKATVSLQNTWFILQCLFKAISQVSLKYLYLCFKHEQKFYEFGVTRWWINDDRFILFLVDYLYNSHSTLFVSHSFGFNVILLCVVNWVLCFWKIHIRKRKFRTSEEVLLTCTMYKCWKVLEKGNRVDRLVSSQTHLSRPSRSWYYTAVIRKIFLCVYYWNIPVKWSNISDKSNQIWDQMTKRRHYLLL